MALAKDHHVTSVQTCAYNGNLMADFSPLDPYSVDEKHKQLVFEEGESNLKNLAMSRSSSSPPLGSPSSANSNELLFHSATPHHQSHEEAHSLINFRGGYDSFLHGQGSLLSFEHNNKTCSGNKDDYSAWDGNFNYNYQWNQMNPKLSSVDHRLVEDINCLQTASNFNSIGNPEKGNHGDWLYSEGTIVTDHSIQESGTQDVNFHKRPHMGENMQALKKQCSSATKKQKPKTSPSKDPQSIAAKNRRERISERLKILQDLVPNGSKVDLVTMLEKAISYVKFLQLQVKVLATDEFWPVQGGKAPDISQVKEAIDAILSSQKDRNSSSSSE